MIHSYHDPSPGGNANVPNYLSKITQAKLIASAHEYTGPLFATISRCSQSISPIQPSNTLLPNSTRLVSFRVAGDLTSSILNGDDHASPSLETMADDELHGLVSLTLRSVDSETFNRLKLGDDLGREGNEAEAEDVRKGAESLQWAQAGHDVQEHHHVFVVLLSLICEVPIPLEGNLDEGAIGVDYLEDRRNLRAPERVYHAAEPVLVAVVVEVELEEILFSIETLVHIELTIFGGILRSILRSIVRSIVRG